MYNTNNVRDCRELLEISNDRFRTKNELDVWKRMRVWGYIFYNQAIQT